MRNTSWKDWFGAEVGFSIYIHRRGFTSSSTNSNQPSLLHSPKAPAHAHARLGSSHQHAGQAPPYRGHKAKFAPCETPPGRVGLVLKLDSLYIYIGGVSHHHAPSIINQCYLPPKARGRAPHAHTLRAHPRAHPARTPMRAPRARLRATLRARPNARDPTRGILRAGSTRTAYARPEPGLPARSASSHQHAGQAHHAGVLHPLVAGSISAPAGRCGVRGPKRSPVARAVASRHTQTTPRGSRSRSPRPRPRPRGSRGPGAGPPQPRVRRLIRGPVPGAKDATVG